MDIERRIIDAHVEVRADHAGNKTIEGYASVFDSRSQNLGGFVERVRPGAFAQSLADGDDVRALMNHDSNFVLGRRASGTLELAEDSTGLHYRITPSNASYARDLVIAMERGDVSQSSFGFITNPDGDEWAYTEDQFPLRSLLSVRLVDVSPVTFPAYLDTESKVAVRAIERAQGMVAPVVEPEDPNAALRRAMFGRKYL
ncbi:HK97 family phage prohead protease [Parafrankia sp. EUN1f]|uniref:HK97 family phage prohead protease n=1 Tax=Parafrankia sp. EUN1f TaxID=102897 RepID=UPI0001C45574|nr:HK97 family phage prohead protease [Parafrankia sp. EUN1f]EFC86459.1 phage prohead protease, HK97 family [Parafrankia sp. EUN1f]